MSELKPCPFCGGEAYSRVNGSYLVIPETVGQYAELSDRDCNKIFEGNIVDMGTLEFSVICNECGVKRKKAFNY